METPGHKITRFGRHKPVLLGTIVAAPPLPSIAGGTDGYLNHGYGMKTGPQAFCPFSSAPGNLTNLGDASSTGGGVPVGYLGRFSECVSLRASYSSRIWMRKFSRYEGLFADQGKFDIAENYTVGLGLHPTSAWTIALDWARINCNAVSSGGNPSTNQAPLRASGGPGFGWRDVNIVKVGVQYTIHPAWIVRAGYKHSENPILCRDVTFNTLASGVVQDHYALGFTDSIHPKSELTMAYMYGPSKTVSGSSLFNVFFVPPGGPANAGGTETIKLSETSLGIAFGTRF